MDRIYYYLGIFLIAMWFLAYMVLNLGGVIHLIFLLGVLVFVYQVLKEFDNQI